MRGECCSFWGGHPATNRLQAHPLKTTSATSFDLFLKNGRLEISGKLEIPEVLDFLEMLDVLEILKIVEVLEALGF